jgi:hypothetical protein
MRVATLEIISWLLYSGLFLFYCLREQTISNFPATWSYIVFLFVAYKLMIIFKVSVAYSGGLKI